MPVSLNNQIRIRRRRELYYRYYLQTNKFVFNIFRIRTKNHASSLLWRAMYGFWGTGRFLTFFIVRFSVDGDRGISTRKRKRFQWFWDYYFSSYFQSSSLLRLLRASILLYSYRSISLSSDLLRLLLLLFFVEETERCMPLAWRFGVNGVSMAIILLVISLRNRISLCCKSVTVTRQGKLEMAGRLFRLFWTRGRGLIIKKLIISIPVPQLALQHGSFGKSNFGNLRHS